MSEGDYSETTNVNFFQRMGQSFTGALFGLLMFLVSFVLLFWNEGRAVDTARALSEAGGAVIEVSIDKVDAANNGKLVHAVGEATTDETLTDDLFGDVSAKAIRLERKVEMYQYAEKEHTKTENNAVGGGQKKTTTYTYEKVWSPQPIASGNFHNPEFKTKNPNMPFQSATQTAKVVKFGAFELSPSLVAQITTTEPLPVSASAPAPDVEANKSTESRTQKQTSATGTAAIKPPTNDKIIKASGPAADRKWKILSGILVTGDASNPEIGDLKVSFAVVKPQKVSVMSAQSGNTFAPFQPKSASHQIDLLKPGVQTAQAMIAAEKDANTTRTWILRLVGFVLMGVGIYLVLAPMATFANIVPFLGGFVSGMVGFMLAVFSCVAAGAMSLITIAIAWLYYRPLLGIGLLVVAGGGIVLLVMMLRRAKPAVKAG